MTAPAILRKNRLAAHGTKQGYGAGCRCIACAEFRPIKHGSNSGYKSGCRCASCVEWRASYMAEYRKGVLRGRERRPIRHGERSGYQRGCRCEPCVLANRRYQAGRDEVRRGGAEREERQLVQFEASAVGDGGLFRCPRDGKLMDPTTNFWGVAIFACACGYAVRASDTRRESAA